MEERQQRRLGGKVHLLSDFARVAQDWHYHQWNFYGTQEGSMS
jgi:hypothetical protein